MLRTPASIDQYLGASRYIDYDHPAIQEYLAAYRQRPGGEIEIARELFEFVRDGIAHSGDIESRRVTRSASEVLEHASFVVGAGRPGIQRA